MLDLSVIIVNYNSHGLLKRCLKSLLAQLGESSLRYKIIVVDNHSRDGSVDMVREVFPSVRLIPLSKNVGYARGVNIGIQSIECRYYLILNADTTIVQKHALDRMVSFMDQHPACGVAGPKLINPDGSVQISCLHFPKFWYPLFRRTFIGLLPSAKKAMREYLMVDWDHNQTRPVDWVIGTGMIVRNEALQQVGLMDERFFMYFEDVDWCRRFWNNDWWVYYIADVHIVHYYSRESAKRMGFLSVLNRQTRVHITSWLKYIFKYLGKKSVHAKKEE